MNLFYQSVLVEFIVVHLIAYMLGIAVLNGMKVNYTRKINHFVIFLSPFIIKFYFYYPPSAYYTIINIIISMAIFIIYIKPVRQFIKPFGVMFLSFDRPEDRPYTLKWLFIQYLLTYIVALPFYLYFNKIGKPDLMLIIIFINAFGDGLAEPVGIRFGRHKYNVKALFTNKLYTRSFEGSACVLIASIIMVLIFQNQFSTMQFYVLLIGLPIAITLAEAYSPHTIDSPFIFLVGGLILSAVQFL